MSTIKKQMFAHGMMAYQAGRYEQAGKYFTEIVAADATDWHARCCLAYCYYRSGESRKARIESAYIVENCEIESVRERAFQLLKQVIYEEDPSSEPVRISLSPVAQWIDEIKRRNVA